MSATVQTLLDLANYDEASPSFGSYWDIDFLSMEVSPGALSLFGKFWDIGGRTSRRKEDRDYPYGLELARSPFVVRLQANGFNYPSAFHDALLCQWGERLCKLLRTTGILHHPFVVPPFCAEHAAKALARYERQCGVETLIDAIRILAPPAEVRLFVCKFGMKTDAEAFFHACVEPAFQISRVDLGVTRATAMRNSMILDLGTQYAFPGSIPLSSPAGSIRNLDWVYADGVSSYSYLGALGGGFGGVQIRGRRSSCVRGAKVYSSGLVHFLKAISSEPVQLPQHTTNRWVADHYDSMLDIVSCFLRADQDDFNTVRVEFRIDLRDYEQSGMWTDVYNQLQGLLTQLSEHILVRLVSVADARAQVHGAWVGAVSSGLFGCSAALESCSASCAKRRDWQRLMHTLGMQLKFSHKRIYNACVVNIPWGQQDDDDTDAASDGPLGTALLSLRRGILPGIACVRIPADMSAADVRTIGIRNADLIDWDAIAHLLGTDEWSLTLYFVCRRTMWRRMPSKSKCVLPKFAASLRGKGSVIGPLGTDLVTATFELVASGQHLDVSVIEHE